MSKEYRTIVQVAVHFFRVYPSKHVQCGAGVALANLPTTHDLEKALKEALAAAIEDKERWASERKALGAIAGHKAAENRRNHWQFHRQNQNGEKNENQKS